MLRMIAFAAVTGLLIAAVTSAADRGRRVVIYDGDATETKASDIASTDLWVTMAELKKATGFVVKPQGVCRDQLCFPLPKAKKAEFITRKGSTSVFNLSAFARLVKQPVAHDEMNDVWYFGKRADERSAYLATLKAPEFTLPDLTGKMHSLADYRGKKVLLITWASW